MYVLILGLLMFIVPHSSRIIMPGVRSKLIDARGKNTVAGIHSVSSLVGIGLIIWGWMLYRPVSDLLYVAPDWGRYVASLFTWIALVLIFMNVKAAGRIVVLVKHPAITAMFFWAFAHLFTNGDYASLLLFGSFSIFAAADRVSLAMRGDPDPVFKSYKPDVIGLVGGTITFLVFYYWAHEFMFGASPAL